MISNNKLASKKIRMKLNKAFPDTNLEDMDNLVSAASNFIKSNTDKYQKDFLSNADFVKAVKDAWDKKSAKEKMDITYSAIDDTDDFENKTSSLGL